MVEHCIGCHEAPGYDRGDPATIEVPSFQVIADDPRTYTPERLRAFLIQPHWPMTRFRLSPRDIDNLIAFIDALRGD